MKNAPNLLKQANFSQIGQHGLSNLARSKYQRFLGNNYNPHQHKLVGVQEKKVQLFKDSGRRRSSQEVKEAADQVKAQETEYYGYPTQPDSIHQYSTLENAVQCSIQDIQDSAFSEGQFLVLQPR